MKLTFVSGSQGSRIVKINVKKGFFSNMMTVSKQNSPKISKGDVTWHPCHICIDDNQVSSAIISWANNFYILEIWRFWKLYEGETVYFFLQNIF